MYYIGIDISKFKHDCAVLDQDGSILIPSRSFSNDCEGFSLLKEMLDSLDGEKRIGFESTGHYGHNLKLFLESNNFTFMEFNAVLIKKFVRSKSLRRTKTDSIDAISIAYYIMTVDYKPVPSSFYHFEMLKSLTRFRENLIHQRSKYLIEITNILDKVFPEFKPFFNGRFSITALYILNNYPDPKRIMNLNSKSFENLHKISRGKFKMTDFVQLKILAKNTVGHPEGFLLDELKISLSIYSALDEQVNTLTKQITKYINDINPPVLSFPGIGPVSAATILSEFGDINRFDNPDKMLSYAGLEPSCFQSGCFEGSGHIVKHGSTHLRYVIMNCAGQVIRYDEVFASFYMRKRNEGKHHTVALTHVAKKMIRVIYTLQTKNVSYDSSLIR